MRVRTVLFDLDGTLIDHFKAIHRCHAFALRQLGLPEPTMAAVRAAVGAGLAAAIGRLASQEHVAAALPLFSAHWDATMLDDVELLPGARELLEKLRAAGVICAVLTNKHGPSARAVCAHLGVTSLLDGIYGATDTPWLKPDPQFVRHALFELKAHAASACLVGDSPYDFATAQNAGIDFIGVATGTHTADELRIASATVVCSSLAGVGTYLLPDWRRASSFPL